MSNLNVPDNFIDDIISGNKRLLEINKGFATGSVEEGLSATEFLEKMQEFQEAQKIITNLYQSRMYFKILHLPACRVCGIRPKYQETPERVLTCQHYYGGLKSLLTTDFGVGATPIMSHAAANAFPISISGIRVEVIEEPTSDQ